MKGEKKRDLKEEQISVWRGGQLDRLLLRGGDYSESRGGKGEKASSGGAAILKRRSGGGGFWVRGKRTKVEKGKKKGIACGVREDDWCVRREMLG